MADCKKRTVIITGANSGIGFGAARMLAEKNYRVILGCRSEERAEEAVKLIKEKQPDADVIYHLLDLSDLSSVERLAEWFLSRDEPLHALVNNAGMVASDTRLTTDRGIERTLCVNHLGHFLLTMRLLDKLKTTASQFGEARIVNVSSFGHDARKWDGVKPVVKPIDFDDLNLEKPKAYSGFQAYKNSKAANILFTRALSRALSGSGVVVNAMCPGLIPDTNIFRDSPFMFRFLMQVINTFLFRPFYQVKSVDHGAQHIVNLVDDAKFKTESGVYYKDFKIIEPTAEEVKIVENENLLWKKSCEMIGREEFESMLN